MAVVYRFDWPRANFFTFFLLEPRGAVRLALGAAFLRAARFTFLRSALSSILVVLATYTSFAAVKCVRAAVPKCPEICLFMVTGDERIVEVRDATVRPEPPDSDRGS